MMIAARLAGGNLFLPFWVGGFFGGDFWEHSEQLGAARSVGGVWAFGKGRCLNKEGILRL